MISIKGYAFEYNKIDFLTFPEDSEVDSIEKNNLLLKILSPCLICIRMEWFTATWSLRMSWWTVFLNRNWSTLVLSVYLISLRMAAHLRKVSARLSTCRLKWWTRKITTTRRTFIHMILFYLCCSQESFRSRTCETRWRMFLWSIQKRHRKSVNFASIWSSVANRNYRRHVREIFRSCIWNWHKIDLSSLQRIESF